MRIQSAVPALAAISSSLVFATPLANMEARQTLNPEPDNIFRVLGGVYCLVNASVTPNGPCAVDIQVKIPYDSNGTWTGPVQNHTIYIQSIPVYGPFGNYHVTIDDVLRNPEGQSGPDNLFGAGITRSYDYPLES